jgi:hypothetical protein
MRFLALLLTALLALSAGCLEEDGDPAPVEDAPAPLVNATAPAPLHWEGTFTAGLDVSNVVTGVPCGPAGTCDFRQFSINGTFDLVATLSWGLPANDLDLYLYEGETEVSRAGINTVGDPPGTTQVLVHPSLPPGDYTFWVVAWNAVQETYELDATFA